MGDYQGSLELDTKLYPDVRLCKVGNYLYQFIVTGQIWPGVLGSYLWAEIIINILLNYLELYNYAQTISIKNSTRGFLFILINWNYLVASNTWKNAIVYKYIYIYIYTLARSVDVFLVTGHNSLTFCSWSGIFLHIAIKQEIFVLISLWRSSKCSCTIIWIQLDNWTWSTCCLWNYQRFCPCRTCAFGTQLCLSLLSPPKSSHFARVMTHTHTHIYILYKMLERIEDIICFQILFLLSLSLSIYIYIYIYIYMGGVCVDKWYFVWSMIRRIPSIHKLTAHIYKNCTCVYVWVCVDLFVVCC